jgi:DNA polymerase eta
MANSLGDDEGQSQFTYRDLRLLSKASVNSPLRVVTLIDFDCFYAQCESVRLGLPPEQPLGVQQFKHVIAMNYAARAAGLKKVTWAEEAKKKCPSIVLQHVPTWRPGDDTWRYRDDALQHMDTDKASLDYYKLQSKKAMQILKDTLPGSAPHKIERAGIDETYVDLSMPVYQVLLQKYPELEQDTQSIDSHLPLPLHSILDWEDSALEQGSGNVESHVLDWDDVCIWIASQIVRSIRIAIFDNLHYTCSAGIARNKVLAKLGSGHNKPNKQTVVLNSGIPDFLATYKFTKLRGLGRKLGNEVAQAFNTSQLSDLLPIPVSTLRAKLGSSDGTWVYHVIRGVEHSEVVAREQLKSVMSAKTFMPAIASIEQADPWLDIFAHDIIARLEDLGGQRPRTIAVHAQVNGPRHPGRSKQGPVPMGASLDAPTLSKLAHDLLVALEREGSIWPLVTLSVDVSNLEDLSKAKTSISTLLTAQGASKTGRSWSENGHDRSNLTSKGPALPPARNLTPVSVAKRTLFDFQGFRGGGSNSNASLEAVSMKKARIESPDHANTATADQNAVRRSAEVLESSVPLDVPQSPRPEDDASVGHSYKCEICQRPVAEADVLEHLDWHAAVELQGDGS